MTVRPLLFILLVIGILGPACGGGGDSTGPSGSTPAVVRIVTEPPNNAQNRVVLTIAPVARLLASNGTAASRSGVAVTATSLDGVGRLTGTTTVPTDPDGRAVFQDLAFISAPGARRIVFTAPGLTPDTSAQVLLKAGAPVALLPLTADSQQGIVGTAQPAPPLVRVADQDGYPAGGVLANFEVLAGGGHLGRSAVVTVTDGLASAISWTLGPTPGVNRMSITVPSVPGLTHAFTAVAHPGPPDHLTLISGAGQHAPVGTALPEVPVFLAVDRMGNPLAGITVDFRLTGTGSLAHASQATDSAGHVSPGLWTLGTLAGTQELIATFPAAPGYQGVFGETADPGPPASIRQLSGVFLNSLVAPTDFAITNLVFYVEDAYGNPTGGTYLRFAPSQGVVQPDSVFVSHGGATLDRWTLGSSPGPQLLTLAIGLASRVDTVWAHAGRTLTNFRGDSQVVTVGTVVPVSPTVRVADSAGNSVAGVPVAFSVPYYQGSLASSAPVITDQNGLATAPAWTVGTSRANGSNLTADAYGLTPSSTVFRARLLPLAPVHFGVLAPPSSTTLVGHQVQQPFWISAMDVYGNTVPGVRVTWQASGGGGVTTPDTVTDTAGIAHIGAWTMPTTPGENRLVVHSTAFPDSGVLITTAVPGPAAAVTMVAGDGQIGSVRHPLPSALAVRVADPYDNPMPAAPVDYFVASGAGSVSLPQVVTDASGIATEPVWTLGAFPGLQTLRAIAGPGVDFTFSATGVAPPPATMTAVAGTGQSVRAGASVAIPLTVEVRDATGIGSAGITVNYTITQGGGSLPVTAAVTDTGGVARLFGWAVGSGPNVVGANVSELPGQGAGFSATGQSQVSAFDITLAPITPLSPGMQSLFAAAASTWQNIIVGDVPDVPVNLPAGTCFGGQPAFSGTIDDLLIYVLVVNIDGDGGILGGTGVCAWRAGTGIPAIAVIELDQADLLAYPQYAPDVILHEMGHALGIGSGWSNVGLVIGAGGPAPLYLGPGAELGYWMVKGARGPVLAVPVENSGPAGTRDVHWAENALHSELMTPYIDYPPNPLSLLTALSLQDLGYQVDENGATLGISFLRAGGAVAPVSIRERPWTGPTYDITPDGRLIPH